MGSVGSAIGSAVSGIGGALFGSDPEVSTQRTPTMTKEQMEYIKKLSSLLTGQLGKGVEPYSGQISPGASPLQSQLFDMLEGRQTGLVDILDQTGHGLLEQGQQPYDQAGAREYWQQAFVDPAKRTFFEDTLPGLDERYAGMGAMSGSGFERAIAQAAGRMDTNLGATLADILFQDKGRHDELGLMRTELGMGALGRGTTELDPLMQAGGLQRLIEEGHLGEEFQKWLMSQPYANPWLQQAGLPLGVSPYQVSHVAQEGSPGLLGSMMPGIGAGIGQGMGDWIGGMFGEEETSGVSAGSTLNQSRYSMPWNFAGGL